MFIFSDKLLCMKLLLLNLALFLGTTLSNHLKACSCSGMPPFYEVAPATSTVALIKVVKYLSFKNIYNVSTPMSMEVEVLSVLKGVEQRKRLIIWGDNGMLCRPYLNTFKEGAQYVMALYKGNPGRGHQNEKETDYFISSCGSYWLQYDEKTKMVRGDISEKIQETSIQKLEMHMKEAADIIDHEPQIAITNRSFPLISFNNTISLNPLSTNTSAVSFPNC
jgi:hypothetical protein